MLSLLWFITCGRLDCGKRKSYHSIHSILCCVSKSLTNRPKLCKKEYHLVLWFVIFQNETATKKHLRKLWKLWKFCLWGLKFDKVCVSFQIILFLFFVFSGTKRWTSRIIQTLQEANHPEEQQRGSCCQYTSVHWAAVWTRFWVWLCLSETGAGFTSETPWTSTERTTSKPR